MNRGGAKRHYETLSIKEICSLRVRDIVADDAALFLWATWPKIYEIEPIFKAWGFTYKTVAFVWFKTNGNAEKDQYRFLPEEKLNESWGMGRYTRSSTEFCLLGTRGKPKRQSGGVHQVIYAPVSRHSEKPPETRTRIVQLMGDLPRVELFARSKPDDKWAVWGNEVKSDITL